MVAHLTKWRATGGRPAARGAPLAAATGARAPYLSLMQAQAGAASSTLSLSLYGWLAGWLLAPLASLHNGTDDQLINLL